MIVGAVLDGGGRPICCELWPGNTTDVTTLTDLRGIFKDGFRARMADVSSLCWVSKETDAADLRAAITCNGNEYKPTFPRKTPSGTSVSILEADVTPAKERRQRISRPDELLTAVDGLQFHSVAFLLDKVAVEQIRPPDLDQGEVDRPVCSSSGPTRNTPARCWTWRWPGGRRGATRTGWWRSSWIRWASPVGPTRLPTGLTPRRWPTATAANRAAAVAADRADVASIHLASPG